MFEMTLWYRGQPAAKRIAGFIYQSHHLRYLNRLLPYILSYKKIMGIFFKTTSGYEHIEAKSGLD
ncbi:MAG: hypothetical protein CK424_09005 [Legionella sp.]|nr:MAG: hypothetical protein CK424_09005 [Legionella sp.]